MKLPFLCLLIAISAHVAAKHLLRKAASVRERGGSLGLTRFCLETFGTSKWQG